MKLRADLDDSQLSLDIDKDGISKDIQIEYDSGYSSAKSNRYLADSTHVVDDSKKEFETLNILSKSLKSRENYCDVKIKEIQNYSSKILELSLFIGSFPVDESLNQQAIEVIKSNFADLWEINSQFALLSTNLDNVYKGLKAVANSQLTNGKTITFHSADYDGRFAMAINTGTLSVSTLQRHLDHLISAGAITNIEQFKSVSMELIKITQHRLNVSKQWLANALVDITKMEEIVFISLKRFAL